MKDIEQQAKPRSKAKKILAITSVVLIIVVFAAVIKSMESGVQEEYAYKETKVQYGTLAIGITESGTVDIGTVEQTFDLDMSALQRVKTGNSNIGNSTGGSLNNSVASGGGSRAASLMAAIWTWNIMRISRACRPQWIRSCCL